MATALTPIAWQSLASATATVTFSSIPGTYRDLRLVISGLGSAAGYAKINLNSDSASNYYEVTAAGSGSSAVTDSGNLAYAIIANFANWTATYANVTTIDFLDYSATDKHKTLLVRNNNAGTGTEMIANRWASTSAINNIVVAFTGAVNFATGTTFALYGVSA